MKRPIYVSTGALVGRVNGYDLRGGLDIIAGLYGEGLCRGLELMMLTAYYDRAGSVVEAVRDCGVPVPVIHCEKDVGTLLSDAGTLSAEGKTDEAERTRDEALRLFRLNCEFGEALSVPRMVIHLWGGYASDRHVDYNISLLPELLSMAGEHGLRLLIENVPSSLADPLSNWRRLLPVQNEKIPPLRLVECARGAGCFSFFLDDSRFCVPAPVEMSCHQLKWSAIYLATYTPLAEAWEREWVTPLPSPIMKSPL